MPTTNPSKGESQEEKKSRLDELIELQKKRLELKIAAEMAGDEGPKSASPLPAPPSPPITKPEESVLGVSLKVLSEMMNKVIEQQSRIVAETTKPSEQQFYQQLLTKFIEAQAATKKEADPISVYKQVSELIIEAQKAQAQHKGTVPYIGDPAQMLQIQMAQNDMTLKTLQHEKEMKLLELQAEKERRQWEEEKLERQQRFQQETERWHWEMELKVAELRDDQERKKKAMAALQNIAQGIAAGIRLEPDYAVRTSAGAQQAGRQKESDFICTNCGNKIPVYQGDKEIICSKEAGGCGQVFERQE